MDAKPEAQLGSGARGRALRDGETGGAPAEAGGEAGARRVEDVLDEAVELPAGERAAYLDEACAGDAALRAEVESLLGFVERDDGELLECAAAAGLPIALPERVGQYRVKRLIGSGGMGVVYEAVQESPRRTVALKVLRSPLASPQLVRRFEHEAEVLGQLSHPGIAQVYEAGSVGSVFGPQPFFAMEMVAGVPLNEYAPEGGGARGEAGFRAKSQGAGAWGNSADRLPALDPRARLALMAKICDAVHHAHQKGVIHRDIKPANILVTAAGDPKILDFGIARLAEGSGGIGADGRSITRTEAGQLMGTLPYMSPEQVSGDPATVDTRSDVYSLGVVMYELLAGQLPYNVGTALADVARIIREEEPAPLTRFGGTFAMRDIATIVGKALQKERERRYQSAAELAADIRRYLNDEPITARPPTAMYQLRKFARRNRALVGGIMATAATLVLASIVALGLAMRASEMARLAMEREQEALRSAHQAGLTAAAADVESRNTSSALRRLAQIPEAQRGWEWEYLNWMCDRSLARAQFAPESTFRAVNGLGAGGVGGRLVVVGQEDGEIWVWDVDGDPGGGQEGSRWLVGRVPGRVRDMAVGRVSDAAGDPTVLVVAATDADGGVVVGLDAMRRVELWQLARGASFGPGAVDSTGHGRLVLGFADELRLSIRDALSGAEVASLRVNEPQAMKPSFSHDGRWISGNSLGTTVVVDAGRVHVANGGVRAAGGNEIVRLPFADARWAVDARGNAIAVGRSQQQLYVMRVVEDGGAVAAEEVLAFDGVLRASIAFAVAERGDLIATTDAHGSLLIWNRAERPWDGGRADGDGDISILRGHVRPAVWIEFAWESESGQYVVSIDRSGIVRVWDAVGEESPRIAGGVSGTLRGIVSAANGTGETDALVAGFTWGGVTVWDGVLGCELWSRHGMRGAPFGIAAFSPDHQWLALGGWDERMELVEARTGRRVWEVSAADGDEGLEAWMGRATALAWSEDATSLIIAGVAEGGGGEWRIGGVRAADGTPVMEPIRVSSEVSSVAALRVKGGEEGELRFAVGLKSGAVKVCNPSGASLVTTGPTEVVGMALHPQRSVLAVAFRNGTVHLVEHAGAADSFLAGGGGRAQANSRVLASKDMGTGLWALAFSPDGSRLALSCNDSTLRILECVVDDRQVLLRELLALSLPGRLASVVFTERGIIGTGECPVLALEIAPTVEAMRSRARIAVARRMADWALAQVGGVGSEDAAGLLLAQQSEGAEGGLYVLAAGLVAARGDQYNSLNSDAWGVVRFGGRPAREVEPALRKAEICTRAFPERGSYINTLGVAQFRLGRYEESIETLGRSRELMAAEFGHDHPLDTLYLAMAHHLLGDREAALRWYDNAAATARERYPNDQEVLIVLRECEALLGVGERVGWGRERGER